MWAQLVLCCLVGLTLANQSNPAWKDNTEYSYKVRGRTLSGFDDYSSQFVGTLLKAQLTVRTKTNGNLYGKISDVYIGEIHTELPEGWSSTIQDNQVAYKPLTMSNKPFEIVMQNGLIRDLIVSSDISNSEANMIKSIVSQFQLDTKAENLIPSHINTLPEQQGGQQNNGVYKTMEDTITGQTETLYEIHPLPRYIVESKPWLVPQQQLIADGQIIEIVKNKNFTNSQERPVYYYGLGGMRDWEPATNQMGEGFARSSVSRIVVTGQLSHYTVQNSHTVSKVVVSPTGTEQQKTMLVSMLNVTLSEVRPAQQQAQEIASPVKLGNLVYRFNKPYEGTKVRPQHIRQELRQENSDSFEQQYVAHPRLFRRSISQELRAQEESQQFPHNVEQYWAEQQQQEEPSMEKAPHTPLMPYTMGYKGQSIKKSDNFNVVEKIEKLAKEIGQQVQQPETMIEEQVLSRFVTLVRLMRIADFEELKQIAQVLYTQEREGPKAGAWIAFRDAAAQSGTGPNFLLIKDWIQTDKITGHEAATVISTMARNVQTPTLEYITKFFELVKSQKVQSQDELKDACALSLGHLLNRVLVRKRFSHNEYPVHTYGRFSTEDTKNYMRQTIIPYFRQQLQQAVQQGKTQEIHLNIRVLGNIADREILPVFEPYLEGQQQISQFQRFFMIVAMDKLVEAHPELAQSVLYKVYQNRAEEREVRLIAIFHIMKTNPSNDMLQRLALATQTEKDQFVAAAIKSSIQRAAKLEGDEYKNIRTSAQAAEHLLVKKDFGWRHAENYLENHVFHELQTAYKKVIQVIPSEGSYIPKYMGISLRSNVAGLKRHLLNVQAMVSGVNQLLQVLEQQTESYKTNQQYSEKAQQNQWSSQHIAKLLKLNVDEKEQLEGLLSMDLGSLQIFQSFDNKTIERLPERIQQWQQQLQQGKQIHHLKFMDVHDFQMAFPTEMGLPFVYSYNKPLLCRVHGKVEAQSQPELVQGGKLHVPKTIQAKTELKATFVAKEMGHVLSVNPFEHEAYVAAYDKVVLVHIPIRADVTVDVEKMQVRAEIEPLGQDKQAPIFLYRSMPYTSKADLLHPQPLFLRPTTKLISHKLQQGLDEVYGQKQTGMAFRVQLQHEQQRNSPMWFAQLLHQQDVIYALGQLTRINKIENTRLRINYLPEQSTNRKIIVKFGYQQEYRSQAQDESNESQSQDVKHLAKTSQDSLGRQQDFLKKTGAGISNAIIRAFDCKVEFQGQQTIQYILTGSLGKSNVDPKSRVLLRFRKESNIPENKQYEVLLSAVSDIENTNGLDLSQSMNTEPKINTQVKLAYGQDIQQQFAEIEAEIKLRRSDSRKQYLTELPLYQECKRQMQQGNKQLDACEQMTIEANYLNDIEIHAQHKNVQHETVKKVQEYYNALRYSFAYMPYIQIKQHQGQDNKVQVHTRFAPNLQAANVTVKAGQEETTIYNVKVNGWMQTVAVPHPVFHVQSRVFGKLLGNQNIRKTCVVDQTEANTFANKTYSVKDLPQQWTVMTQYVPQRAHQQPQSGEQLLQRQTENYLVLVRASKQNQQQKEVKITFNNKQTKGQVYDITMKPGQGAQKAQVFVNDQQVKFSDRQSHDIQQGLVQIYALPNGEVKVEIRDNFYVIYDGERAKLTLRDSKFRGQVRGLCGQDNEYKYTDFLTADRCIVSEARDFIRSYNVEQPQEQQRKHCARQHVQYVNVVSKQDANRGLETKYGQSSAMGTTYQTRYIEKDGEICFTRREYPVCRFGAPRGTVTKNVSVHCVQKTAVANLWKDQIDNGQNPSFSTKSESKQLPLTVPQGCSQ